jgi:hypothetical protein
MFKIIYKKTTNDVKNSLMRLLILHKENPFI